MSQLVKTGSVLPHLDSPTHNTVTIYMHVVWSLAQTSAFIKVASTKALKVKKQNKQLLQLRLKWNKTFGLTQKFNCLLHFWASFSSTSIHSSKCFIDFSFPKSWNMIKFTVLSWTDIYYWPCMPLLLFYKNCYFVSTTASAIFFARLQRC